MILSNRLSVLEKACKEKTVDNIAWVIEVVEMNENREIVTVGRHYHFKD